MSRRPVSAANPLIVNLEKPTPYACWRPTESPDAVCAGLFAAFQDQKPNKNTSVKPHTGTQDDQALEYRSKGRRTRKSGLTLVEIMVATGIFAILSVALTATFVQSLRFAKIISHRTQAINTATSIVEQLRAKGFTDLFNDYYLPSSPPDFTVKIVDPGASTATPSYYKDLILPINVRGTTTLDSDWTETEISVDSDPNAPKLPMKLWLSLDRDSGTGANLHEVFQITLIYQWRSPGAISSSWKTGNLRIVAAKSTVGSAN